MDIADQVNAQAVVGITAFNDIWYAGQFLFGLHLLVIGYLAYRSGYVPKLLGALIAISGLGYAADSLGAALSPVAGPISAPPLSSASSCWRSGS